MFAILTYIHKPVYTGDFPGMKYRLLVQLSKHVVAPLFMSMVIRIIDYTHVRTIMNSLAVPCNKVGYDLLLVICKFDVDNQPALTLLNQMECRSTLLMVFIGD